VTLFGKDLSFTAVTETPFNGHPPLEALAQAQITPLELFFVRNHGNVPLLNPATHHLTIEGLVEYPLSLTLSDLAALEPVEITAALQCAGNRRDELAAVAPIPGELPWTAAAISNAVWGGVRLGDVLAQAGITSAAAHVAFTGLDAVTREGQTFGFGGSIPLAKALDPETLLVTHMNGEPLPPLHGAPLRVLVPGYLGARSVKWLGAITVQAEPSANYFQRKAYTVHGEMLGENAPNSVICWPLKDSQHLAGTLSVMGYALNGGDPIQRVEVSADDGRTWHMAHFLDESTSRWAWRLWSVTVEVMPGEQQLIARAFDSAGRTQPRETEPLWNVKGYANNAWHRIRIYCREAKMQRDREDI
jgi:sulfite oxidase